MDKIKFLLIIIFLLAVVNVYFVTEFILLRLELRDTQRLLRTQETSEKAVYFTKLFVEKVLSGHGEVNFEDRLKLENAVRDIDDNEIFSHWQNFVNSKTDAEAQREVGLLLSTLLSKVSR